MPMGSWNQSKGFADKKPKAMPAKVLYREIMFHTENGTSPICAVNFLIQETHKRSGKSRASVIALFKEWERIGFIEEVLCEKLAYHIKQMMTLEELLSVNPNRTDSL